MSHEERLISDFVGTGATMGPHPMAYHREAMKRAGVTAASGLKAMPDGVYARVAGAVIARQRPGTAEGFIFLSLEDETGISNAIINPHLYERNRVAVTRGKYLQVEGTLQNQDGVVNMRASSVRVLALTKAGVPSHDFHSLISDGLLRTIPPKNLPTAQRDVAIIMRMNVCSLVNYPEQVELEIQDTLKEVLLRFHLPKSCIGQVIGKQG